MDLEENSFSWNVNRLTFDNIKIKDEFWTPLLDLNAKSALIYQYAQLNRVGTIENFRLIKHSREGMRQGFFYTDSDAHKWAEAALYGEHYFQNQKIQDALQEYAAILMEAQTKDGYLYTYNQFHFPSHRWKNLQIEHELYCFGHLIEAGVTAKELGRHLEFFDLAIKGANRIVQDFQQKSPLHTPGHQEIEIALLRLFEITQNNDFLTIAEQFLKNRGKISFIGFRMIQQSLSQRKKTKIIQKQRKSIYRNQTDETSLNSELNLTDHQLAKPSNDHINFAETNFDKDPFFSPLRFVYQALTGKYHQQHRSFFKIKTPTGHAVRWGYYMTAWTMLARIKREDTIIIHAEKLWDQMVRKKMYITGGLGALPMIEGFGRDYELPLSTAYAETCAAIASICWSWELLQCTCKAQYADLMEWQIYNAMNVGVSQDGQSYFYRNILKSNGGIQRNSWYKTPCCPSNISRIWGRLAEYIYLITPMTVWINQYVGNRASIAFSLDPIHKVQLQMSSKLPWEGSGTLQINIDHPTTFTLQFRIPSWTEKCDFQINQEQFSVQNPRKYKKWREMRVTGPNPYRAFYVPITREWKNGDTIKWKFSMPICFHTTHLKVHRTQNAIAVSRGPLMYCYDEGYNLDVPIDQISLSLKLKNYQLHDMSQDLSEFEKKLPKISLAKKIIHHKSGHRKITLIPYYLWGNLNPNKAMQLWMPIDKSIPAAFTN